MDVRRRSCIFNSPHDGMTSRYNPIPQEAFDEQVYSQFYDPHASSSQDHSLVSHRLSLMFIVLAIGALMDPQLPPFSVGAEKYFQLAHASLFHNRLFEEPTISAVQALVSTYIKYEDIANEGVNRHSTLCHFISSWPIGKELALSPDGQSWD
jgi:hypothetical protein